MAHLWSRDWFDIADSADVLENISEVWAKIGFEKLTQDDLARLEPFLEPFDAIYNDEEITILSRLGHNGIQKEFCRMFTHPKANGPDGSERAEGDVFVLEWYLEKGDYRRSYLVSVATILYGSSFRNDQTQCMIMLTHSLARLRKLKITIQGDALHGEPDHSLEPLYDNSLEEGDMHVE